MTRVFWLKAGTGATGLVVGLAGWASVPNSWSAAKAAGLALAVAGLAAGISAVKNLFLADGSPVK